jgi:hypothetical protein
MRRVYELDRQQLLATYGPEALDVANRLINIRLQLDRQQFAAAVTSFVAIFRSASPSIRRALMYYVRFPGLSRLTLRVRLMLSWLRLGFLTPRGGAWD